MSLLRTAFLLLPASLFLAPAGLAAPPAAGNVTVYSDLCRTGDGFQGSRLSLAPGRGVYQWGESAADTAPVSRMVLGADGKIAFRYMPDADNPEVLVEVAGTITDAAFTGAADGKPLRLPRLQEGEAAIPACR